MLTSFRISRMIGIADLFEIYRNTQINFLSGWLRMGRSLNWLIRVRLALTRILTGKLKNATSKAIAKHLKEDVFLVYGVPERIICDNGKQYAGKEFKKVAASYDCKITFNANYHPQANPTERTNREYKTMIRSYIKGNNHRDWDDHLLEIGFALRTAVHEVTGYSPAYLNFSRELLLSGKLHHKFRSDEGVTRIDFGPRDTLPDHVGQLKEICAKVKLRFEMAYKQSAVRYNLRRRPFSLEDGQSVWRKNYLCLVGCSKVFCC